MNKNTIPNSDTPSTPSSIRLSDQVYESVLGKIISGEFPVNSKLPTENELSKTLSVSRPVLRQALARLRQDEMISSRQGSGSYVNRQPAPEILNFSPKGSFSDIQRCFEFRTVIEGAAAALAATNRTEPQLASIESALMALETCIANGDLGADADEQFHSAICIASDNPFFVSSRASAMSHIEHGMKLARKLSLTHTGQRLEVVQAEHRDIFLAIKDGDPERASEAMKMHISNARRRVFES